MRQPGRPRRSRRSLPPGLALEDRAVVWSADAALMLATRRSQLGYSQVRLAHQVGCSQQVIASVESGDSRPSPGMLDRICQALGLRWYQPPVAVVPEAIARKLLATIDRDAVFTGPPLSNSEDGNSMANCDSGQPEAIRGAGDAKQ